MPSADPIRVLSVDRSPLVRAGTRAFLDSVPSAPPIAVVGESGSVAAALALTRSLRPDVVLLGLRFEDGSGIDACRRIRRESPDTHVIVLTGEAEAMPVEEAVQAGAQGYLLKELDPAALAQAIVDVAAGKAVLAPAIAGRVLDALQRRNGPAPAPLATLSAQEQRVLALITDGLTNREVAQQLGLTENTVKNYLTNVFDKLQVRRRSQAAALFARQRATPQRPGP